jgi:hypothetical protein
MDSRQLVKSAVKFGRFLPEDFQEIPGVQGIRDMARSIFPRFREWRRKSRSSFWGIYHNPYAMGLYRWERETLRYIRSAVEGVVKGDDIYAYYMCAMAYHNLLAMSCFLRDRPKHRLGFQFRKINPNLNLASETDRLLYAEFSSGESPKWEFPEVGIEDNPSIESDFVSDDADERADEPLGGVVFLNDLEGV